MATTVGVFLNLFPTETLVATIVIAFVLLLIRNWDLACGLGFATLVVSEWLTSRPLEYILYTIVLLLLIAIRKWMQRASAERKGNPLQLRVSR